MKWRIEYRTEDIDADTYADVWEVTSGEFTFRALDEGDAIWLQARLNATEPLTPNPE